jgi:hypothetical protein
METPTKEGFPSEIVLLVLVVAGCMAAVASQVLSFA